MLRFILGLPIDAARWAWRAFRWLVLSPGMGLQETFPSRLMLVRALVAMAAASCVLHSTLPLPLGAAIAIAAGLGPSTATLATALQALAQCAWSERSGRY
jgi:uncharacterized membrane protein YedE/YeeE